MLLLYILYIYLCIYVNILDVHITYIIRNSEV